MVTQHQKKEVEKKEKQRKNEEQKEREQEERKENEQERKENEQEGEKDHKYLSKPKILFRSSNPSCASFKIRMVSLRCSSRNRIY